MRPRFLLCVTLFGAALFASGCASTDVRPGYRLAAVSGKGLVAVGVTADDSFPANFFWRLRRVGQKETRDVTFHSIAEPLAWSNPRGRLVLMPLDDGDYEFFDWPAPQGLEPAGHFRVRFHVKAGRVAYLGRIHLAQGAAAGAYAVSSSLDVADDRPTLAARIVNFSDAFVDASPAVFDTCDDAACSTRTAASTGASTSLVVPVVAARR